MDPTNVCYTLQLTMHKMGEIEGEINDLAEAITTAILQETSDMSCLDVSSGLLTYEAKHLNLINESQEFLRFLLKQFVALTRTEKNNLKNIIDNINEATKTILANGQKFHNKLVASLPGKVTEVKEGDVLRIMKLMTEVTLSISKLMSNFDILRRMCLRNASFYKSLNWVAKTLFFDGPDRFKLILGFGFNQSNEWLGKKSFGDLNLHTLGINPNPYEQAISLIGNALLGYFDDDVSCFGFGDASTKDENVFSFYPNEKPCKGFEDTLKRYKELASILFPTGPLSFSPIIEKAIAIAQQNEGIYTVLVILANEEIISTKDFSSLTKASKFPLSIVIVGVGDGPWNRMRSHSDIHNFHFVNFSDIMMMENLEGHKHIMFALEAFIGIPDEFKAAKALGLRTPKGVAPKRKRMALSPPVISSSSASTSNLPIPNTCSVCLTEALGMAFGCGHMTCCECGERVVNCPTCRKPIKTRIKLYF